MEIMATSKNYRKKKFGSLPGYFEPLWEKSNYGKIGRRRRLSKLNVFFSHNSVGDHTHNIYTHNVYIHNIYIYMCT